MSDSFFHSFARVLLCVLSLVVTGHSLALENDRGQTLSAVQPKISTVAALLEDSESYERQEHYERALAIVDVGIKTYEVERRSNSGFLRKNLLKSDFYDKQLLLAKVRLLYKLRRYEDAEIQASELVSTFPKFEHGQNALAVVKMARGDIAGALNHVTSAHRLNLDNSEIHSNYMMILAQSKAATQANLNELTPERSVIRSKFAENPSGQKFDGAKTGKGAGIGGAVAQSPMQGWKEQGTRQRVSDLMKNEAVVEASSNINYRKLPDAVAQAEQFKKQSRLLIQSWLSDYLHHNSIQYINYYGPQYVDVIGEKRPSWEFKMGNSVRSHPYTGASLVNSDIRVSGSTMFASVELELEYWIKASKTNEKERKTKIERKLLEFENIGDKWLIVREVTS